MQWEKDGTSYMVAEKQQQLYKQSACLQMVGPFAVLNLATNCQARAWPPRGDEVYNGSGSQVPLPKLKQKPLCNPSNSAC